MVDPVPLDEARRRKRGKGKPPASDKPADACPVVALGHADGDFVMLDVAGQQRRLNGRQIISVGELSALFGGQTAWLEKAYPRKQTVRKKIDDEEIVEERIVGFNGQSVGQFLIREAFAAGLFGPHVVFRRPGIWRGEGGASGDGGVPGDDGAPIVHAGDAVLLDGEWQRAGFRRGDIVWSAHPPQPRPAAPCGVAVADAIQQTIRELWQFRHAGGEIVVLGLVACGLLGHALGTRPNGFLTGGTNSGKSMLLHLMRACAPQHHYTTDTTKAGLEGAVNGRAVPSFVDESSDRRGDGGGAERLMDIVLGATTGDGGKIDRGTVNGGVRSVSLASVITMAATNPPELLPQHLRRFTIVELVRPPEGADNSGAMRAATARCAAAAPGLWGRVLASWRRWDAVVAAYRHALARARYDVSAMDQAAAWLAGWWVLVEDGVPDAARALDGVASVAAYLRVATEVADDDAPRRMLRHLATSLVQRAHTTDRVPVARLVARGWGPDDDAEHCRHLLTGIGIRLIRESDVMMRGKPVSRRALGDGMWFSIGARPLKEIFAGIPQFEGDRWVFELMRFPSAVKSSPQNVRVGDFVAPAIWLSRGDWDLPSEEDDAPKSGGKPPLPDG